MHHIATIAATIARKKKNHNNGADYSHSAHLSEHSMGEGSQASSRPLLRQLSTTAVDASTSYGTMDRLTSSPETYRRNSSLGRVPEESADLEDDSPAEADEEEDVESELAAKGLYVGSYDRTVALYGFVPTSGLILLVVLAILPPTIWKLSPSKPLPHSPYFPSPLPELLVSTALWSLSHLIRLPIYTLFSSVLCGFSQAYVTVIFHLFYAIIYNVLRLSALPILRVKHQMNYPRPTWRDIAFRRIWWLALGWAAIEIIVGVVQDYAKIALYEKVMVPEEKIKEVMGDPEFMGAAGGIQAEFGTDGIQLSPRVDAPGPLGLSRIESINSLTAQHSKQPRSLAEALEMEVDRDMEQLVNLKEREELEEIYGVPIIKIPVFVSCLQRIASITITIGIFLILSASYLRSNISMPIVSTYAPASSTNLYFFITFPLVVLLNTCLSVMYTPIILPRLGVHVTAYIAFLIGLGTVFAGLGLWGALA